MTLRCQVPTVLEDGRILVHGLHTERTMYILCRTTQQLFSCRMHWSLEVLTLTFNPQIEI